VRGGRWSGLYSAAERAEGEEEEQQPPASAFTPIPDSALPYDSAGGGGVGSADGEVSTTSPASESSATKELSRTVSRSRSLRRRRGRG
jgi:hypothetical protein